METQKQTPANVPPVKSETAIAPPPITRCWALAPSFPRQRHPVAPF
ncbi:hypothetical protein [Lyngbya sp. CCY1209]|nr:hypothetical protein [Lyngbya sp. CCY1209]MEB3884666.1 hypothetical protein [Lyngbya sp. CCY1209]